MTARTAAVALAICILALTAGAAQAAVYNWVGADGGDWLADANWQDGSSNSPSANAETVGATGEYALDGSDIAGTTTTSTFAAKLTLASGGVLRLAKSLPATASDLYLSGGTVQYNVGGGTGTLNGNMTVVASTTSTLETDSSNSNTAMSIGALISGSGNLVKIGNRSLSIGNGSNTFSGRLDINEGSLSPTSSTALQFADVYVNSGGVFDVAATTVDELHVNGGTISNSGQNGTLVATGGVFLDADSHMTLSNSRTQEFNSSMTGSGGLSIRNTDGAQGTRTTELWLNVASSGYSGHWEIDGQDPPTTGNGPDRSLVRAVVDNALGTGPITVKALGILRLDTDGSISSSTDLTTQSRTLVNYDTNADGVGDTTQTWYGALQLNADVTVNTWKLVDVDTGNETYLAPATYSAASHPDWLTGAGTLTVLTIPAPVPEPATLALLATAGLLALPRLRRRRVA